MEKVFAELKFIFLRCHKNIHQLLWIWKDRSNNNDNTTIISPSLGGEVVVCMLIWYYGFFVQYFSDKRKKTLVWNESVNANCIGRASENEEVCSVNLNDESLEWWLLSVNFGNCHIYLKRHLNHLYECMCFPNIHTHICSYHCIYSKTTSGKQDEQWQGNAFSNMFQVEITYKFLLYYY